MVSCVGAKWTILPSWSVNTAMESNPAFVLGRPTIRSDLHALFSRTEHPHQRLHAVAVSSCYQLGSSGSSGTLQRQRRCRIRCAPAVSAAPLLLLQRSTPMPGGRLLLPCSRSNAAADDGWSPMHSKPVEAAAAVAAAARAAATLLKGSGL